MTAIQDNELMNQVKNGDSEKLGILFERYHKVLYSFFYNMTKDQELSEDLVQNTFIRILSYRRSFKGSGQFKTWMFHIARNVNADNYKKMKRLKSTSFNELDESKNAEQMELPEEKEHEFNLLQRAFDCLDDEKKEILLLSKYQGKKYAEIGKQLNCSEGAVKVRVFRALQALKEQYINLSAIYN